MGRGRRQEATRYGVSPWSAGTSRRGRARPAPGAEASASVVIVGGGLTGCAVAYACGAAGLDAMLLEEDRLASGASAAGDGILRAEPAPSLRALEARFGRRRARVMCEMSRRAVLDAGAAIRRLAVRGLHVEAADALRIVPPFEPWAALQKEAALRGEYGLDARWLVAARAAAAARTPAAGGMRMKAWATTDPYAFALALARAAEQRGVRIHERTRVTRIRSGRGALDIRTEGGRVTADTVVVCTGEPTDLFRPLKRHFEIGERHFALTAPLPASIRREAAPALILTDTAEPPHACRWVGNQLLMAGADSPGRTTRAREAATLQRTGQLMYELSRLYPAISGTPASHGWSMPTSRAVDGVMVAGPHRNFPRHLFAWGTGHDPASAYLASRVILRHLQGEATREDAVFGFTRR